MVTAELTASVAGWDGGTRLGTVVLVHGLASNRTMLRPLEQSLRSRGYNTVNWGYPSIRSEIRSQSAALARELNRVNDASSEPIHLVTHSMGSILARVALDAHHFDKLGRVVMLGPPHRGSRVARKLARVLGWLCRPLKQLSDHPSSFVNSLAEPRGYEIGIIAASRDRVVRIEDTRLDAQTDHVIVNAGHTSMLFRQEVVALVDCFLQSGLFARPALTLAD
jgi:pimeloyl-ACP methyl ester carboxylesterase